MEVVRRRRLTRGEPHAEVERALGETVRLMRLFALAVFDDAGREGDVLPRLEKEGGPELAQTLRHCSQDTGEPEAVAAIDLVRRASKLAAWLRGIR